MRTLYETIMELCAEKNIKGAKLCSEVGISKSLLTDLKMGRRTGVSAITAQKIASYFNVSVSYLLGKEDIKKDPAVSDEADDVTKELYSIWNTASEEERAMLLDMARVIKSRRKKD